MRCEQLPPSSPSCASVSPFAPIQAELGAPSPDASEPEPQIETFAFKLLCLAGPALPEYQSRAGGCAAPTSSPPDGRWEWGEGSEPQSSCRLGVQQPPGTLEEPPRISWSLPSLTNCMSRATASRFLARSLSDSWPSCRRLTEAN